MLFFFL